MSRIYPCYISPNNMTGEDIWIQNGRKEVN